MVLATSARAVMKRSIRLVDVHLPRTTLSASPPLSDLPARKMLIPRPS
jgi:hypothetical protein